MGIFSVYFTLFSPQSGPRTIREHVGTSGWVLVGFCSIQTLSKLPSVLVSPFFPKCVTYVVMYTGKNQTSKVSLCGKCTARDLKTDICKNKFIGRIQHV